jgi:hypothetical protein
VSCLPPLYTHQFLSTTRLDTYQDRTNAPSIVSLPSHITCPAAVAIAPQSQLDACMVRDARGAWRVVKVGQPLVGDVPDGALEVLGFHRKAGASTDFDARLALDVWCGLPPDGVLYRPRSPDVSDYLGYTSARKTTTSSLVRRLAVPTYGRRRTRLILKATVEDVEVRVDVSYPVDGSNSHQTYAAFPTPGAATTHTLAANAAVAVLDVEGWPWLEVLASSAGETGLLYWAWDTED